MDDRYDILVVGAGYAGSVMAERLATRRGRRVLVIDRRDHIAGNAFDYYDEHGVLVHRYGPHIFHTNSDKVVEYLSQFTEWRPYEHRVLARVDGKFVPMPINRTTINELYGLGLGTDEEVETFLAERAEPVDQIRNSEDVVVAKVGPGALREVLPRLHPQAVAARPVGAARLGLRADPDPHEHGRPVLHRRLPENAGRRVHGDVRANPRPPADRRPAEHRLRRGQGRGRIRPPRLHGPDRQVLRLPLRRPPYRSLEFELRNVGTPDGGYAQPTTTVNEPSEDVPYTRTTEFRRMTGQERHDSSTLAVEYPRAEGDPYYPIPRDDTRALYRRYEALGDELSDVTFVGRLARYQYLNMDQVVGQALSAANKLLAELPERR